MKVAIRLLWHKQAQFAGYLVAEALRLGERRGVSIVCQGVDFACKPVEAVLSGAADMAVASPAHVLESRAPGRLKVVLAIQQASPLVYPAKTASGIRTVADLAGRRVGVWPGHEDLELRWMLARAGVAEALVERIGMNDTVGPFLAGEVDCAQMTTYHELHQVEHALGHDGLTVLTPAALGCSLLKDGLIVASDRAKRELAMVQAVVDSVLEGWTIAFDDPERAVAICGEARPDVQHEEHRTQLAEIRRLSLQRATLTHGLGYPDPEHAARAAEALAATEGGIAPEHEGVCDTRFWSAAPQEFRRRHWS
jgi:ABC-type nitrate/sulfonate/bicarbonate transport system substrate-binding protein